MAESKQLGEKTKEKEKIDLKPVRENTLFDHTRILSFSYERKYYTNRLWIIDYCICRISNQQYLYL